jgi:hypothetical protein
MRMIKNDRPGFAARPTIYQAIPLGEIEQLLSPFINNYIYLGHVSPTCLGSRCFARSIYSKWAFRAFLCVRDLVPTDVNAFTMLPSPKESLMPNITSILNDQIRRLARRRPCAVRLS